MRNVSRRIAGLRESAAAALLCTLLVPSRAAAGDPKEEVELAAGAAVEAEVDCPWVRLVATDSNGEVRTGAWGVGHFLCDGNRYAGVLSELTSITMINGTPWVLDGKIEFFRNGEKFDELLFELPARDSRRLGLGSWLTRFGDGTDGLYAVTLVPHLADPASHMEPASLPALAVLQRRCDLSVERTTEAELVSPELQCFENELAPAPNNWGPANIRR